MLGKAGKTSLTHRGRKLRRAEILLSIFFFMIIAIITIEANRLGIGYIRGEGPAAGFLIFWLAMVLVFTVGTVLVRGWRMKEKKGFFLSVPAMWSVAQVALLSIIFCILIWKAGVYIATFLLCAGFSAWLGKHRWYVVLLFAILTPIIIYFGFEKGLMIPLPKSPLYGPGILPF